MIIERLSAVVPVVFSAVSFALIVVLAVAGSRVGAGSEYFILSLNTSNIGSGTIQFDTVSDPTPGFTDPTGLLDGIITGIADPANQKLQELEAKIVNSAIDSIGIKDVYNIYMLNICEGQLVNADNPNSISISSCPTYHGVTDGLKNVSSRIPSSVVIGATNITVPILQSLGPGLNSIQDLLITATNANFALLIIGLISSGIVMLLSIVSIVLPRVRFITYVNLFFATLAPLTLMISTMILTVLMYFLVKMINGIGSGLGISAIGGTKVITLSWIAWTFSVVSGVYWFLIWFVYVRKSILVRRPRNENEVGQWSGLISRTRRNLSKGDEKVALQQERIAMNTMRP